MPAKHARSTPPSTPRLSEAARHLIFPSTIASSVYPRIERRLTSVGVGFDPWQRGFGSIALGLDSSGKYASTVGGVVASIPRQVGKTFTVGHLLIGLCLEFPGMRVIWTSHHGSTTKNTLQSMEGMLRNPRLWPHVANVYVNNNDMRVLFKNGSSIMFGARDHGFGRGMDAVDVVVFDEAQKMSIRALEDTVPSTNQARHEHGALLFFIGTPPRPSDAGEMFTAKREQALAGSPDDDMVYVEFSAEQGADPQDRSQWPAMNPSYPSRTPLAAMLRMRKNMPDLDSWRREAMGVWDETSAATAFGSSWGACAGAQPDGLPVGAYGVAASLDLEHAAIVAAYEDDGVVHVKPLHCDRGAGWVVDRLTGLQATHPAPVVIDGRGPTATLLPQMEAADLDVTAAKADEVLTACAGIVELARDRRLRHAAYPELDRSVDHAVKQPVGDRWKWGRKPRKGETVTPDISPLEAATLAAWHLSRPTETFVSAYEARGVLTI